MTSTSPSFCFEAFAEDIYRKYREKPYKHCQPYLLPALYGGEPVQEYEIMFVLEAPSVSFTEPRWKRCSNTAEAIQVHRCIFLDWAYAGSEPAYLFNSLCDGERSLKFYRRFYVTDLWKDAVKKNEALKKNVFQPMSSNQKREYRDYWRRKLRVELQEIRAEHVIFVGKEAAYGKAFVENGHFIPFPIASNNPTFRERVDCLRRRLRGDVASVLINTPPPAANTRARRSRHRDGKAGGDRDALWRAIFSPATPATPLDAARVLAAHPDAAARTARLVAEPSAGRVVAIANAMFNACRRADSEGAWRILLTRRDTPHMRAATKWERLVDELGPMPEWAANQLRRMDIMALGSLARGLIRAYYRL